MQRKICAEFHTRKIDCFYKKYFIVSNAKYSCQRNIFTTRHRNDFLSQENLRSQEKMDALLQSHGYKKFFVSQEFFGSQSSIDVLSPENISVTGSYISCVKTKFPVTGRDDGAVKTKF